MASFRPLSAICFTSYGMRPHSRILGQQSSGPTGWQLHNLPARRYLVLMRTGGSHEFSHTPVLRISLDETRVVCTTTVQPPKVVKVSSLSADFSLPQHQRYQHHLPQLMVGSGDRSPKIIPSINLPSCSSDTTDFFLLACLVTRLTAMSIYSPLLRMMPS